MTRHEQDRVHEASGIAFTFAGHLVWGNPKLAEGLHGDIEAWRCGRCYGLMVGAVDEHAEQHMRYDALVDAVDEHAEQHMRYDALVGAVDDLYGTVARLSHGAFKPVEVPGAVLTDTPKPSHRDAAELRRGAERVTAWRDAATVHEVEPGSGAS